ncbi:alpha-tocopherol transfer protein-like [Pieris napi]|uniref:alpha-tocopherol transfer protein-like n=1 Tax=Pieris napi TaxID=78633 RepID=UPI001FB905B1|nr:alpha-tocopherol transfer protein-like [Pieris napi]XP_047505622.1 alpha-tocopherol transfer protein-like [Pieris napi]XP_047505624.1 alpha-tocopherol transfer protein-like [Pieris napi]
MSMSKDVAFIKEWMAKEAYLPRDIDDMLIQKFLHSCYGSLEKTKKCIDRFCSTRSQLSEIYTNRDPQSDSIKTIFSVTRVCAYKAGDDEILIHHYDDPEFEHFAFYDLLKTLTVQADYWINFHNVFPRGHIVILDMSCFSLKMVPKSNIMYFRDFILFLLEGMPVRVHKVYGINAPSYYDKLYSLVKPVLPAELCNIIHFFHDYESLHKHIDKKYLPVEYGGDAPSTKTENQDWIKRINEQRKMFLDDNLWKADLKMRPKSDCNAMNGSFRTLSID